MTCTIEPWPDHDHKVEGITLELRCRVKVLHQVNLDPGSLSGKYVTGEHTREWVTSTQTLDRELIDEDGTVRATVRLPPMATPTVLGFRTDTAWEVVATLKRRRGIDDTTSFPFTVNAVPIERLRAARPAWHADPQLAASAGIDVETTEPHDVRLVLEETEVERGQSLRGHVLIELDPLSYLSEAVFLTKRGRRKAVARAESLSSLDLESAGLEIQCLRVGAGSQSGRNTHTIWSRRVKLDVPNSLEIGRPYRVPFDMEIPHRAGGFTCEAQAADHKRSEPLPQMTLPPTWYGAIIGDDGEPMGIGDVYGRDPWDDHFLWILSASLVPRAEFEWSFVSQWAQHRLRATRHIFVI